MADLSAIQDRFRSFIYLRSVHANEWFEDFDNLRSGRVSVQQFHRVFDTIHFLLTDEEFNTVANAYKEQDGRINYRKFLSTVEDVFSNRDLERVPGATVRDPRKIVTRTLGIADQSDDRKYQVLFAKLSHQIATLGIHIRESYEDFDKHNNGTVTQSQFFRALPFKDLTGEEMQLLVKRYADPILRDVNYRRLILDINSFNQNQRPRETFSSGLLPHQLESIQTKSFLKAPEQLMSKFTNHVREKRIRIREFFKQHDPLNKGIITKSKFEGTLSMFGFSFTEEDFQYLTQKYGQTVDFTEYVRYVEFCDDIYSMTGSVEDALKTRTTIHTRSPVLENIIQRIRDTIIRFRINSLPTLQDFDKLGRGYITKLQFHRGLATLGISITTAELDMIAAEYEGENGIDFYKFVEDVDSTHKQDRRSFKPIGTDKQSIQAVYGHTPTGDAFITPEQADGMIYESKKGLITKTGEKHDIDSLLYELKRWSYVNSVDFHDFLSDFDKHKNGEITTGQFRTGMGLSTYKMTDPEFELIVANYASESRQGYFKWKKFADDIIQAIAPLELEKAPVESVAIPKDTFNPRAKAVESRSEVPEGVRRILDLVARFVKSRRISLVEQFKDKDRFNHKRVSATGFAQVLQLIGVHLSKAEIDVLCSHYNDPAQNFVDYTLFVNDVDAIVGLIFGDRAATGLICNPIPDYGNADSPYLMSKRTVSGDSTWESIKLRLQSYIFKRRIRMDDFFFAFDNLRSGKVTDQKFRSVVGQTGIPLSAGEIDMLIEMFRVPETTDMFDYKAFCHQLNKIFGKTGLEKKPVAKNKPRVTASADPSATTMVLESQDQQKLDQILNRMKYMVVTRRMNIREQFADYDKAPHKNFITKPQFKQCIARLGLSTNPAEFDILCKKYRCTDLEDMNYHAFCDDIDSTI